MAALCMHEEPVNYNAAQAYLNEAINITVPGFTPALLGTYLLGYFDHKIIAMIARIAFETGSRNKAITILEKLTDNISKRESNSTDKAVNLAFLYTHLARYYGETKKYKEQLDICNEGIRISTEKQRFGSIPYLVYYKAFAMRSLGGDKDEITELLYQAYYGSLMHAQLHIAEDVRRIAPLDLSIPKRQPFNA